MQLSNMDVKRDNQLEKASPTVAHVVGSYLPRTQTWIYSQMMSHHPYRPIVLATAAENLDEFPLPHNSLFGSFQSRIHKFTDKLSQRFFGYRISYNVAIKNQSVSILHAHFGHFSYRYALPLAKKNNLPLITTFYGFDMSRLPDKNPKWLTYYKDLFTYGTLFLVEGNHMRNKLIELGCPSTKVRIKHLGIDHEKIKFVERDFSTSTIRILFVGRLTEKKGLYYGLQAIAKVKARYPNIQLSVIGSDIPSNGSKNLLEQAIARLIVELDIAGQVHFMGSLDYSSLLEEYKHHHIMFAPSVTASDGDTEGGAPVCLVEAIATGLPVVASNHCDIPEVVPHNKVGLLANERDVDGLAENLLHLINDRKLMQKFSHQGRLHSVNEYDLHVLGNQLTSIYDDVLSI